MEGTLPCPGGFSSLLQQIVPGRSLQCRIHPKQHTNHWANGVNYRKASLQKVCTKQDQCLTFFEGRCPNKTGFSLTIHISLGCSFCTASLAPWHRTQIYSLERSVVGNDHCRFHGCAKIVTHPEFNPEYLGCVEESAGSVIGGTLQYCSKIPKKDFGRTL